MVETLSLHHQYNMKTKIGIGIAVIVLFGAVFFGNKELFRGFLPGLPDARSTPPSSLVVSVNSSVASQTHTAGTPNVLLGSWGISVGREGSITLQDFVVGPATALRGRSYLQNISLRINGSRAGATLSNLGPRENRFSTSLDLEAGSMVVAEVFADVPASYTPIPEIFALKAGALGVSRATGKSVKSNSVRAQNITIASHGELVLTRDPAGPVARTLTPGEHVLGSWILRATPVEDLRVTKICSQITGTVPAAGVAAIKFKDSSGRILTTIPPMIWYFESNPSFRRECEPYPIRTEFTVRAGTSEQISLVATIITPLVFGDPPVAGSTIGSRIGNIEYIGLSSATTNTNPMLVDGPMHTITR